MNGFRVFVLASAFVVAAAPVPAWPRVPTAIAR